LGGLPGVTLSGMTIKARVREGRLKIIPSQDRIESVGDDAELEEVYNTERHLLYVASTRARDHLLLTGVAPASEFLNDFVTA
jgi:superfamily I DNA/RNA helicase